MTMREQICYWLSRKLMSSPAETTIDYSSYSDWRSSSLTRSVNSFSSAYVQDKDVLDFGCGDGHLSIYLAQTLNPRSVVGIDLLEPAIARAREHLSTKTENVRALVEFVPGKVDGLPFDAQSFDSLFAFDCLEHVMAPEEIMRDWLRVLRPGGRCMIEWFPFKGPWGPHMEALVPIPWAHVIFGEKAMFRAAERIYDLPDFVPRHWDLDENGNKRPNKWRAWASFKEQGYVNELDLNEFKELARKVGFKIDRLDSYSFGGSPLRRKLGRTLMKLPFVGEYFVSYTVIELVKPGASEVNRTVRREQSLEQAHQS